MPDLPELPDAQGLLSDATEATGNLSERLQILDPDSYPDHLLYVWAAALVVGVGICLITPIFRRIEIVATLVHELGHGLGGMFGGRKFNSFSLHPDASGVTNTSGAGRLGLIFCFWSGYSAPGTVALLITVMLTAGVPSWPYALTVAILVLTLIRARSLTTLAVIFTVGAATAATWWSQNLPLQSTVLIFMIGFFLTAGIRQIGDAWKQRKIDGGEADGDALASLTFIPEVVWLMLFFIYTAVCATLSTVLLVSLI